MHANGKTAAKHRAAARKRYNRQRGHASGTPVTEIGAILAQDRRFARVREIERTEGRKAGEVAAMCGTKTAYKTLEEAKAEVDRKKYAPGHATMRIYRCPRCGLFHITHKCKKGAKS